MEKVNNIIDEMERSVEDLFNGNPEHDSSANYVKRIIAAYERSLWRPVSEPPEHQNCVITNEGLLRYSSIDNIWYDDSWLIIVDQPTIWRELPVPPPQPEEL